MDNITNASSDPKYGSLKVLLIVAIFFVLGFFAFKMSRTNDNTASVVPPPSAILNYQKFIQGSLTNDPDVTILQQYLTSLGFYTGPINGNFDMVTKNASKAYKTSIGVQPAGGQFNQAWSPISGSAPTVGGGWGIRCLTDFNNDGDVNIVDYIALQASYGTNVGSSMYDLNKDNNVDLTDTLAFMKAFGRKNTCYWYENNSQIPEGTLVLSAPAPLAIPSGSTWGSVVGTVVGSNAWAWDYRTDGQVTYVKQKMPVPVTINNVSIPGAYQWTFSTPTVSSVGPGYFAKDIVGTGPVVLRQINGKLTVVKVNTQTFNGIETIMTNHYYLKPKGSQMGSFDQLLTKVGNTLKNDSFVDKKSISLFDAVVGGSNNLPPISANPGTMQNPLAQIALYPNGGENGFDNSFMAETGFDFPSFTDERLESINLADGPTGYNPETNTISMDLDNPEASVAIIYIFNPNTQQIFTPDQVWTGPRNPFAAKGTQLSCFIKVKSGDRFFCPPIAN
jgi:peptidoglycan hydrolase-like protein with peptidoglycan-binding domain